MRRGNALFDLRDAVHWFTRCLLISVGGGAPPHAPPPVTRSNGTAWSWAKRAIYSKRQWGTLSRRGRTILRLPQRVSTLETAVPDLNEFESLIKGEATEHSEQCTVPLFYSDNAHRPRHQGKTVCLRHRANVASASARHVLDVELDNLFMPGPDHFISTDGRIFYPSITACGTGNDSSIDIAFLRQGPERREYHGRLCAVEADWVHDNQDQSASYTDPGL